jgi:putative two-component system response regulator
MMMLPACCKVLVAEDDPATRRQLAAMLAPAGFQVALAENGRAALALARSELPMLLVADWEMPELDGLELCRRLRVLHDLQDLFIVLLAPRAGSHDPLAAHDAGADDFLIKPVVPAELVARLRGGLRTLSLRRQLREAQGNAERAIDALNARALELVATRDAAVFALAALAESRDPETGEHLERLRCYSQLLAEELSRTGPYRHQIDRAFLEDLYRSSPLHDIGKVGIPDAILRKPGKLTPDEFEIMKRHTTIGAEALARASHEAGCAGFLEMAVEIARYHHERFDGRGYPAGLSGRDIPLPARIVALADVYDALTSPRVYKEAFAPELARSMIEEQCGRHFDPVVVEAFRASWHQFSGICERVAGRGLASLEPAIAL